MADRRWDGDERGEGIADASPFVDGAVELIDAMRRPNWVAEQPEVHLLPHLQQACQSLPLRLVNARESKDGSYDVRLRWTGDDPAIGVVREAVFSLIGAVAEVSSYIRQRRGEPTDGSCRTLLFELVTGIVDGETRFAPHGHTLRISVEVVA